MALACTERLLFDAADRADGAVQADLARRGHPVPVVDVVPSSSHATAPASGEFAEATRAAFTTLPSLDVQFGPAPCVPTCVNVAS